MYLSPLLRLQPHILSICGRKKQTQIQSELHQKNSTKITHLNLSHSNISNIQLSIPTNIIIVTANMCQIQLLCSFNFAQLIEIQVSNNLISQLAFNNLMPHLKKLTANKNKITILHPDILKQCPCLETLSLYQNQIVQISTVMIKQKLKLCHQILDMLRTIQIKYHNDQTYIGIDQIIKSCIPHLNSQQFMKVCSEIVEASNIVGLSVIIEISNSQLNEQLLLMGVNLKKHKVVGLLIKKLNITRGYLWDRLWLMDQQLFTQETIRSINPQILLEAMASTEISREKIKQFLQFLRGKRQYMIKSIIQLTKLIELGSFHSELLCMIIQNEIQYFEQYQFNNFGLLRQLLSLDSCSLLERLLQFQKFEHALFQEGYYLKIAKSSWKTYRILRKKHKLYISSHILKKSLHFREYGNSQSIFIRKQIEDSQLLKQYDLMQGYNPDNIKLTFKLTNQLNSFSIAKKIDYQIKANKSTLTTIDAYQTSFF